MTLHRLLHPVLFGLAAIAASPAFGQPAPAPPQQDRAQQDRAQQDRADQDQAEPIRPEPFAAALPYVTELAPVENEDLAEVLEASSNLIGLQDEPPPGLPGLARRAADDAERLRAVLRSFGYYAGIVDIRIGGFAPDDPRLFERAGQFGPETPVPVRIEVEPGPQYTVSQLEIGGPGGAPLPVEIDREVLGLAIGDPARAEAVLTAQERVIAQIRLGGHPFARLAERQAVVDHATRHMLLEFAFEPGPYATLGPVTFEGLERTREAFLQRRVPFEVGDPYSPEEIDALRADLASLGVFSSIRIDPADTLNAEGGLPITVTLAERAPRFIGFGASYGTTEGLAISAFWGHRNLFGGAETLRIQAAASRLLENAAGDYEYGLNAAFRNPDLWLRNLDLLAEAGAVLERPEAFEREAVFGSLGFEYRLSRQLAVGAGLSASQERVTDITTGTNDFTLIGVPLFLRLDTTDDLLDPTRGARLNFAVTPFPALLGSTTELFITRANGSAYYDFGTDGDVVLAGRLGVGSVLWAPNTLDVPASRRFYAGGGGSVRGYGFQNIGPQTAGGDPIGGRALLETGLELRYRITETIGIVPFVDAGTVYDAPYPDFSEDLRVGVGIGARYYTGFGPIRVDIAVPLQPRDDDPVVAFYVSLGQSF